ncbi:MAG: VOC family protein [Chloroflexota bacterium]|nr:VOC family protein [Chloroflexota bacterium]
MPANSIHPDTTLGYVHLNVGDLKQSLPFYQDVLGFQVKRREGDTAFLGAGSDDILALTERHGALKPRFATGLYHFAVLVPSRLALAQSLRRLIETEYPLQGFADHLVSEAIYLADPDGNGIEIYRDRPRREWYDAHGKIKMATDPLDVRGVLAELPPNGSAWRGLDAATKLGHMHLQVANARQAQAFYSDALGFDLIMMYGPSAAFVSAGGYHHHIGMNAWNSAGAPPPPPESIGLRYFVVRLPDLNELGKVVDRVRAAGIPIEEQDAGLLVRDPSQIAVVLTAAEHK